MVPRAVFDARLVEAAVAAGAVLRRHTVDFTVAKKGEIHVFTYSNMEITEGEGKGTKSTDSFSYVYRADEESFFEVAGLLPGEVRPHPAPLWPDYPSNRRTGRKEPTAAPPFRCVR